MYDEAWEPGNHTHIHTYACVFTSTRMCVCALPFGFLCGSKVYMAMSMRGCNALLTYSHSLALFTYTCYNHHIRRPSFTAFLALAHPIP